MSAGFQRGPRAGDAKSLWNFCTSPGWTRDEIRTLQLCLMKYGVGQWSVILNTGLLPGKVVAQLSSQTQRLLGQQSLAVFSGLRVDVDRIRTDNAAKIKVTRKGGVIIHTGNKLTPKEIETGRNEIWKKYALTEEQQIEVDQELEMLKNAFKNKKNDRITQNVSTLLDCDVEKLNHSEKISLLIELREALKTLELRCRNCIINHVDNISFHNNYSKISENQEVKITHEEDSLQSRSKTHRHKKQRKSDEVPMDDESVLTEPLESSIEAIMNLGYTRRHALDALAETDNNTEEAIQWLLLNCN